MLFLPKTCSTSDFAKIVYEIVSNIPLGYVLTYGTIALLAGRPRNARLVGAAMSKCPRDITSHRVVNHMGRTVPGWNEQIELLKNEGVAIKSNGCVDLKKHLWRSGI